MIMTTKQQMIKIIKDQNPDGLRVGNEETGYTQLTDEEYNAQIEQWADNALAREARESAKLENQTKRLALLDRLGLSEDEAKLLIS